MNKILNCFFTFLFFLVFNANAQPYLIENYNSEPISIDSYNNINFYNKDYNKNYPTFLSTNPVQGRHNITVRIIDNGCFKSNIEVLKLNANKEIIHRNINFNRNENPNPLSVLYCLGGTSAGPTYFLIKDENTILFQTNFGIAVYNITNNSKKYLPLILSNQEQLASNLYMMLKDGILYLKLSNSVEHSPYYKITFK